MNKIYQFMSGRNGNDRLGLAMLIAALILNIVFRFTGIYLLGIIAMAMVVLVVFRMFSRNVQKRQEENRRFVSLWSDAKKRFSDWRTRKVQSKNYKFFTCPGCKNKLRVPRGKGKIQITCPKCGQRFNGKS
ncbi:MAG: hypothetical protein AB7D36_01180 [Oscillospiraceae bacterium]